MTVFTLNLNLDDNQTKMVQDIVKYVFILSIFHFLATTSDIKNFGLLGNLFNENFLGLLLLVITSFLTYHLIVEELIEIR